jgi:hypothetical protein
MLVSAIITLSLFAHVGRKIQPDENIVQDS